MTTLWYDLDEIDEEDKELYEKDDFPNYESGEGLADNPEDIDSIEMEDFEHTCPLCGAVFEGDQCDICGWVVQI